MKNACSAVEYKCDICSEICDTQGKLNKHLKNHSSDGSTFDIPTDLTCYVCDKTLKYKKNYKEHTKNICVRITNPPDELLSIFDYVTNDIIRDTKVATDKLFENCDQENILVNILYNLEKDLFESLVLNICNHLDDLNRFKFAKNIKIACDLVLNKSKDSFHNRFVWNNNKKFKKNNKFIIDFLIGLNKKFDDSYQDALDKFRNKFEYFNFTKNNIMQENCGIIPRNINISNDMFYKELKIAYKLPYSAAIQYIFDIMYNTNKNDFESLIYLISNGKLKDQPENKIAIAQFKSYINTMKIIEVHTIKDKETLFIDHVFDKNISSL